MAQPFCRVASQSRSSEVPRTSVRDMAEGDGPEEPKDGPEEPKDGPEEPEDSPEKPKDDALCLHKRFTVSAESLEF